MNKVNGTNEGAFYFGADVVAEGHVLDGGNRYSRERGNQVYRNGRSAIERKDRSQLSRTQLGAISRPELGSFHISSDVL